MVRDFAENEVKPVAMEYDQKQDPKDCVPWDLIKKASELGLRTAAIPEKFGASVPITPPSPSSSKNWARRIKASPPSSGAVTPSPPG